MIVPDTKLDFILTLCTEIFTGLLPTTLVVIRLPVTNFDPLNKQSCSRKDCEASESLQISIGIYLIESSPREICPLDMNDRYSSATSFADTTPCSLFCDSLSRWVQQFAALCPVFDSNVTTFA